MASSRLPEVEGDKRPRKSFKAYPIGYFHIDIAEVRTGEGKLYLFIAIDRTYKINIVLTDNGMQFADLPKNRKGPTATWRGHPFDPACRRHEIEHRSTKPNHPWTNGQVERMNRTLKEATVKRYDHESHDQLRVPLADFLAA